MKKIKNNSHKINPVLVGASIAGCSIGGLFLAAQYYVNLSIQKKAKRFSGNSSYKPQTDSNDAIQQRFSENRSKITAAADKWYHLVSHEDVSVTSRDELKLHATLFPFQGSDKYIITVHGYNGSPAEMHGYDMYFNRHGYNVLNIDLRAHGESEGAYIGMGWLDRIDLLCWITFLTDRNPQARIALFGHSMGAATVMMACGENLPSNVKVCVEDSGYTSVADMFRIVLKKSYHLPAFPLLNAANVLTKKEAHYEILKASALDQVRKSTIPIMFIHGEQDSFVPFPMVYQLYEAATVPKAIYTVPYADHVASCYYSPEAYYSKVFAFIDKYL